MAVEKKGLLALKRRIRTSFLITFFFFFFLDINSDDSADNKNPILGRCGPSIQSARPSVIGGIGKEIRNIFGFNFLNFNKFQCHHQLPGPVPFQVRFFIFSFCVKKPKVSDLVVFFFLLLDWRSKIASQK